VTNNFITFRRAWLMPYMVKHKSWDDHFFQKNEKDIKITTIEATWNYSMIMMMNER
jgi:hypothetical protein